MSDFDLTKCRDFYQPHIDRLTAENERLRRAMEEADKLADKIYERRKHINPHHIAAILERLFAFRKARAALKASEPKEP